MLSVSNYALGRPVSRKSWKLFGPAKPLEREYLEGVSISWRLIYTEFDDCAETMIRKVLQVICTMLSRGMLKYVISNCDVKTVMLKQVKIDKNVAKDKMW